MCQIKVREVHCLPHFPPPPGMSIPLNCPTTPRLSSCTVAHPASKCLPERAGNLIIAQGALFSASVVPACHNTAVESCKFNKQGLSYQNKVGDKRVDCFCEKKKKKQRLSYLSLDTIIFEECIQHK